MRFLRWCATRLGSALLTAWVVATVVFFALRAAGGDPTHAILGGPGSQASPETMAAVVSQYGLDQPLIVQYGYQLLRIITFDLGDSYARRMPVADLISAQLVPTVVLAAVSLALAWIIALALAIAATRGSARVTALLDLVEIVASVLPHFWVGAIGIALFASSLGWVGATSPDNSPTSLALPALTLALPVAGFLGQVMRDGLTSAHRQPFATSSRARGGSETWVFLRHSLRHGALPAVSLTGWAFGSLLSGAVVVETLFARPGVGRLLIEATHSRDVPLVIGVVLVIALGYVLIMAITDLIERALDPRVGRP